MKAHPPQGNSEAARVSAQPSAAAAARRGSPRSATWELSDLEQFVKRIIILRVLINDKLSADINLKLNMFAWLGLLMAHTQLLKIGFKKIS